MRVKLKRDLTIRTVADGEPRGSEGTAGTLSAGMDIVVEDPGIKRIPARRVDRNRPYDEAFIVTEDGVKELKLTYDSWQATLAEIAKPEVAESSEPPIEDFNIMVARAQDIQGGRAFCTSPLARPHLLGTPTRCIRMLCKEGSEAVSS